MKDNIEIVFLKPGESMADWDSFVTDSPQGSLFCYSWWLEAVCPEQFEIILLMQGTKIIAGMPMHKKNIWGFKVINMPPFTQTLGVLFPPNISDKYEKNLTAEMNILKVLISAIPKVSVFNIMCNHNFSNWLPFYWAGYRQTTFYSYAFEDLADLNKIFSGFAYSKRKNIKRAESIVEIKENISAEDFFTNHKLTLSKQGKHIIYRPDLFYRIFKTSIQKNSGKAWYAIDKSDNIHAAIFVVYDTKSAYFLISSIDPDHRDSGAVALLVRHAIEYLAPLTKRFDFEGSMDEGIESSFRRFGARQVPYFNIFRYNIALDILQKIYISIKVRKYQ